MEIGPGSSKVVRWLSCFTFVHPLAMPSTPLAVKAGDHILLDHRLRESCTQTEELSHLLSISAGFGHEACTRILLECQADPNSPSLRLECGQRPESKRSALHKACVWNEEHGKYSTVVKLLLQQRANVDLTAKFQRKNMTALEMARRNGHIDRVLIMQEHSTEEEPLGSTKMALQAGGWPTFKSNGKATKTKGKPPRDYIRRCFSTSAISGVAPPHSL